VCDRGYEKSSGRYRLASTATESGRYRHSELFGVLGDRDIRDRPVSSEKSRVVASFASQWTGVEQERQAYRDATRTKLVGDFRRPMRRNRAFDESYPGGVVNEELLVVDKQTLATGQLG